MQITESEIERRIALLRKHPVLKSSGWSPTVSCSWLSSGLKIISITLLTGRDYNKVMTVTRDSMDLHKAIDAAFNFITAKVEEAKAKQVARDALDAAPTSIEENTNVRK